MYKDYFLDAEMTAQVRFHLCITGYYSALNHNFRTFSMKFVCYIAIRWHSDIIYIYRTRCVLLLNSCQLQLAFCVAIQQVLSR